ncbi:TPA: 50S ribosomal protein L35 [Patescibacteria group bacterium]|nr:50S ribosomal protein L35 [Patescibacteria group bacterium]
MARQKTNKTAKKRFKLTNPKGKKKGKLLYKRSHQNHLKTKRSRKTKRRYSSNVEIAQANRKNMLRKIVNI